MSPTRRNTALAPGAAFASLALLPHWSSPSTRHLRVIVPSSTGSMAIVANPAVILASAGRIRAVGVTGKRRYAALPDVPTIAEAGLDAAGMANWYALFAWADTPSYTRRDIEAAIRHALDDAMVRRQMLVLGAQPLLMDATRFARHVQAQRRVLEAVMAQGGRGPA